MDKAEITELCEALGWFSIPSKNPYMISFKQEETNRRLNIYFTNMTVTIEDDLHQQHHHKRVDLEQLEMILTT